MLNKLKIWAREIRVDGKTGNTQAREVLDEEYQNGYLRKQTVSTQVFNSIIKVITKHSNPSTCSPYLFYTEGGANIPFESLEMNGQSITQQECPDLFETYRSNLPDLTGDAPTGFTYIVRKQ